MKKLLLFLLVFAFSFGLAACGKGEETPTSGEETKVPGDGETEPGQGAQPNEPIDLNSITFENQEVPYTGSEIYIECTNVPDHALVMYTFETADGPVDYAIEVGVYTVTATIYDLDFNEVGKKTATLTIVEAEIETQPGEGGEGGNEDEVIDVTKFIFADQVLPYTGSPVYVSVRNMPETVTASYVYKLNGTVIEEMIEVGVYEVTATVKDATGTEIYTKTALITITDEDVYDEIPKDADSNIELTYTDHYVLMFKNPDDPTQLIAARIDLWARETFKFVLDRDTTLGAYNEPLKFFNLSEDSVECASLTDNVLTISEAGIYDIILIFPAGEKVPTILVTESGEEDNTLYFRTSANDFAMTEANSFTMNGNQATYEATLAVGDVFRISNYYSSLSFNYDPYFTGMNEFEAAEEVGAVQVFAGGKYKFVIDLDEKTIVITKDGVRVEKDTNMLYVRGSFNETEWSSLESVLRKVNGIAIIEIELPANGQFKIANADWSTQYNATYFTSATAYFGTSGDPDQNVIVKQAGLYRFELNVSANKITVYYNGTKIIDNATGSSAGGNQGGETQYSYQLVINGTEKITLTYKGKAWVENEEHDEFVAYNVHLNAGDVITLFDVNNNAGWAITNVNPWSSGSPVGSASGITIGETGNYDIYVQFLFQKDKIYFGPAGA